MTQILAYDNCFNLCSVALKKNNNEITKISEISSFRNLTKNIKKLVGEDSIEEIRFTVGPGSFTGLRIGIATAFAIQSVKGCKLTACSTFDLLLQQAILNDSSLIDATRVSILIDAKRKGVVYFSETTIDKFLNTHPDLSSDGLKNIEDLENLIADSVVITNHESLYRSLKSNKNIYIDKCSADALLVIPSKRFFREITPIYF